MVSDTQHGHQCHHPLDLHNRIPSLDRGAGATGQSHTPARGCIHTHLTGAALGNTCTFLRFSRSLNTKPITVTESQLLWWRKWWNNAGSERPAGRAAVRSGGPEWMRGLASYSQRKTSVGAVVWVWFPRRFLGWNFTLCGSWGNLQEVAFRAR